MVGQLDYLILINFAVVFQLLIYSSYLIYSKPGDTGSRSILLIIFFIFLVSKLDDLLQQSGAIWQVPDIAFLGTSLSLCLGPCIALYVNRRTQPNWQWQQRQLWHLSWLLVPIVYLFNNWWLYGSEEKLQLLRSGEFANTTTLLLLPSFGDSVLLCYLVIAVNVLRRHGASIRQWFSNALQRELVGLRKLLVMFAVMMLLHLGWVWARGSLLDVPLAWWFMALLVSFHLVLVNGLFIEFVTHKPISSDYRVLAVVKQSGQSNKTPNPEDIAMLQRLKHQLQMTPLHLNPDLTIAELARPLNVHYRILSQAINQVEQKNFHEFINQFRIEHAKSQLLANPACSILDIAYASGFNSKSTFNAAFKKITGYTPTEWRKQHQELK